MFAVGEGRTVLYVAVAAVLCSQVEVSDIEREGVVYEEKKRDYGEQEWAFKV